MESSKSESQNFINLGVILNDKNEVLIIKRVKQEKSEDGSMELKWAFPGGKQMIGDDAETREECVVREVLAETGYHVSHIRQISLRRHPQFPVFIAYHLCKLESAETEKPVEPWEIEEVKWVPVREINNYFTTDIDPNVAKELKIG